jgi:Ca2+-binding RTX toxin-like protein
MPIDPVTELIPCFVGFEDASSADGASFFAYEPAFRGGVFVASSDVNGDGASLATDPNSAAARVDYFLHVDGIDGESTDDKHRSEPGSAEDLFSQQSIEPVAGGDGRDVLIGGLGDDWISGGTGQD